MPRATPPQRPAAPSPHPKHARRPPPRLVCQERPAGPARVPPLASPGQRVRTLFPDWKLTSPTPLPVVAQPGQARTPHPFASCVLSIESMHRSSTMEQATTCAPSSLLLYQPPFLQYPCPAHAKPPFLQYPTQSSHDLVRTYARPPLLPCAVYQCPPPPLLPPPPPALRACVGFCLPPPFLILPAFPPAATAAAAPSPALF